MASTAMNSEAAAIDSLSKRMDRLMDSKSAALDRMMRRLEETLARMDGAPAPVAPAVAASAPSSLLSATSLTVSEAPAARPAPSSTMSLALYALAAAPATSPVIPAPSTTSSTSLSPTTTIDTTMLVSTTTREPLHTPPARCSTPGRSHGERALALVAAAPPASPSPTAAAAMTAGVVITNVALSPPSPTSTDVGLAVGESTSSTKPVYSTPMVTPPTPSPSQGALGSGYVEVTTKQSTSSTGAQKVFDEMVLQHDVFTGAALDTTKHNHITVLSTVVSSMVTGSTKEKGGYMLQDFLRVRNRRIDKASEKRLRVFDRGKHIWSASRALHGSRTTLTIGDHKVFDRGKVVELISWTLTQKGGSTCISSQLAVCCQLIEWSVLDELWGLLVFDRRKRKKSCNMIFFQMAVTHEADAGLAEEDDYMMQGSLCVRDHMLNSWGWALVLQRPPWPPPVQLEKLLVFCCSVPKCKMALINGEISELLTYQDGILFEVGASKLCYKWLMVVLARSMPLKVPCDNYKKSKHRSYALCIQKIPWPPPVQRQEKLLGWATTTLNIPLCSLLAWVSEGVHQKQPDSHTMTCFCIFRGYAFKAVIVWKDSFLSACISELGRLAGCQMFLSNIGQDQKQNHLLHLNANLLVNLIDLYGLMHLAVDTNKHILICGWQIHLWPPPTRDMLIYMELIATNRLLRLHCKSSAFLFLVLARQQRNESSSLFVSTLVMYFAILHANLEKKGAGDFQLGASFWREGLTCFPDSILVLAWSECLQLNGLDQRNTVDQLKTTHKIIITTYYMVLTRADMLKFSGDNWNNNYKMSSEPSDDPFGSKNLGFMENHQVDNIKSWEHELSLALLTRSNEIGASSTWKSSEAVCAQLVWHHDGCTCAQQQTCWLELSFIHVDLVTAIRGVQAPWDPGGLVYQFGCYCKNWNHGGFKSGLGASRILSGGECHVLSMGWATRHGPKAEMGLSDPVYISKAAIPGRESSKNRTEPRRWPSSSSGSL